ncbi:MAG: type II toxin-antitoxin system PemK/MazF family toxin [Anaerolineae bacterium]|nr:type II toxin-antitoxin system PemK/MazF family toxin [Anaerolineae bacterium]
MIINPGDFWVADIPFTDGSASKKRPVLVLWLDGQDVIVAAVTSAAPRTPADVSLVDWRTGGLRVPSTVRLSRLDCLEQFLLLFRLGHVSPADAQRLKDVWAAHIKPRF